MPTFGSPFTSLTKSRKVTGAELIAAIRFSVVSKYKAAQWYKQLARLTDNELAVEVLEDIANEERLHAGEFLRLLRELVPNEKMFYLEGEDEVEEFIKKLKKKRLSPLRKTDAVEF